MTANQYSLRETPTEIDARVDEAAALRGRDKVSQVRSGREGKTIQSVNPATEEVIAEFEAFTPEQIGPGRQTGGDGYKGRVGPALAHKRDRGNPAGLPLEV